MGKLENTARNEQFLQAQLFLIFDPQMTVIEQRLMYPLGKLLTDLGGYLGLLLGFSTLDLSVVVRSETIKPVSAEQKIRQFDFEWTLNVLICNGNGLSQCSL